MDVVVVNRHRISERPYPIRIPWEKAGLRLIGHRGGVYSRDYARVDVEEKTAGRRLDDALDSRPRIKGLSYRSMEIFC